MEIISLFSGAGGLDLGFTNKGFKLVFANDNDKDVWETFEKNHKIQIDKRSITNVRSEDIPDALGIIGGPPCQSWSLAGSMKGMEDPRGKVFYEYLRILKDKMPLFFLAENVPGIASKTHRKEFEKILAELDKIGYNISYKMIDAAELGVPQNRKRIVIIGYRKGLNKKFDFNSIPNQKKVTLKDTILALPESTPAREKNRPNTNLKISNHEHMDGGFSTIYMSRNRKRNWDEQSFTIQAGGRHAPLHPSSTEMVKVGEDKWKFKNGDNSYYRRLSVRECARIQTFPDSFIFYYDNLSKGYKMVGNAVPVKLTEAIAATILNDLQKHVGIKN